MQSKAEEIERRRWVDELETQDTKQKKKVLKMAKVLVKQNKAMVGGGCIKDENGKIVVQEETVRKVWTAFYEKLIK